MPSAYLALSVFGAVLVLNAYRPVRRDPLTTLSFFSGWPVGELAVQSLVLSVVVTAVFAVFGAFTRWPGWVGLGLAGLEWIGLVGLAVVGARAAEVVHQALTAATGPPLAMAPTPPVATWGRWWRLTRALPLRSRAIAVVRDVDYWGDGVHPHHLDVYLPAGAPPVGAPVMVYIHGGAWIAGDKREQGKPMMFELVTAGWVCVTVNYRLSPRATWPDQIVDCKRALAWVHEHIAEHGGDPSFVAVSGGSAGGHLAALAALTAGDPDWQPGFEDLETSVAACVPFYGVYDMTADRSGTGKYGPGLQHLVERQVMKLPVAEHRGLFERASPTYRVHRGAPPFFILHGTNDTLVPVESARQFVAELRATTSAPVAYAELPLAQHAFDLLASLRCRATTGGVRSFLDGVRAGQVAPGAGADESERAPR